MTTESFSPGGLSQEERYERLRDARNAVEQLLEERLFDGFTSKFLRTALAAMDAATCMELDEMCAIAHTRLHALLKNGEDFALADDQAKGEALRSAVMRIAAGG